MAMEAGIKLMPRSARSYDIKDCETGGCNLSVWQKSFSSVIGKVLHVLIKMYKEIYSYMYINFVCLPHDLFVVSQGGL